MQNHAKNQSIKKIAPVAAVAFVATMLVGAFSFTTAAYAAVTFDSDTGTGFVGKGDVQTALELNNKQIQERSLLDSLQFRVESTVVTEFSWVCTNEKNENVQERERTTTTTIQGLVSSQERVRNQVTGFNLLGYSGSPTESSETEGQKLNSCPEGKDWVLTTPASEEPEVISSSSTVQVSRDGTNWINL